MRQPLREAPQARETHLRGAQAGHEAASSQLLKRQLMLLGRVVRASESDPMKVASFIPNSLEPATNRYVRRVGCPRLEWVPQVMREAYSIAGGAREFLQQVLTPEVWRRSVYGVC